MTTTASEEQHVPPNQLPPHPGKIAYYSIEDGKQRLVSERSVNDVPDTARYAQTSHGMVPVVKVVATTTGNQRFIREYGPQDEFLRATTQLRTEH